MGAGVLAPLPPLPLPRPRPPRPLLPRPPPKPLLGENQQELLHNTLNSNVDTSTLWLKHCLLGFWKLHALLKRYSEAFSNGHYKPHTYPVPAPPVNCCCCCLNPPRPLWVCPLRGVPPIPPPGAVPVTSCMSMGRPARQQGSITISTHNQTTRRRAVSYPDFPYRKGSLEFNGRFHKGRPRIWDSQWDS